MSRGWKNNSQKHSLAKKGIKTKNIILKSKGEIKVGENADFIDIINYLKKIENKPETSIVVDKNGKIIDFNEGEEFNVSVLLDRYDLKDYHSHPFDAPPSIADIHIFLSSPQLIESWVITPNYLYQMYFKNNDNLFKNTKQNVFDTVFWKIIQEKYGKEFIQNYNKLSNEEKVPIYEEFLKEITYDTLWIDKYEILPDNKFKKVKEIRG